MMSNAEKFATSLVALALVRNGYEIIKDIPGRVRDGVAILAVGNVAGDISSEETFAVAIKVVRGQNAVPVHLDDLRAKHRSPFARTVYFAFFVDKEKLLIVDDELHQRMRFHDEEIRLEALSAMPM